MRENRSREYKPPPLGGGLPVSGDYGGYELIHHCHERTFCTSGAVACLIRNFDQVVVSRTGS